MNPVALLLFPAIGLVAGQYRPIREQLLPRLQHITLWMLLPVLLFSHLAGAAIDWQYAPRLLLSYYLPLVLMFGVLWWRSAAPRKSQAALLGVYTNMVFMGLPVISGLLGSKVLVYAYIIIAPHSLVCFLLYYLSDSTAGNWRQAWRALANPIVISLMAALLWQALGWQINPAIDHVMASVSLLALPCALLLLGASLQKPASTDWHAALPLALNKLVWLPVGVGVTGGVMGLDSDVLQMAILLAACPVGLNAMLVTGSQASKRQFSALLVWLTTIASPITIVLWYGMTKLWIG